MYIYSTCIYVCIYVYMYVYVYRVYTYILYVCVCYNLSLKCGHHCLVFGPVLFNHCLVFVLLLYKWKIHVPFKKTCLLSLYLTLTLRGFHCT